MRTDLPVRVEQLANDKDGTLEKRYFRPEARIVKNDDGTQTQKTVEPWEVHATGKKCYELKGAFKDSAPQMMQDGWKEWQKIGEVTITKPDGSTDVVRADKEQMYRDQPGFCVHATKPTFTCNVPWEGSMRRLGIKRQRVGKHVTETWYHDGRRETVFKGEVR